MSVLLVLAVVIGLAVARVRGGPETFPALRRVAFRRPWFAAGVAVALLFTLVPGLSPVAWVAAAVLAGIFVATNRPLPGLWLTAAGITLNAVVVVFNGGELPVAAGAARRAGLDLADLASSRVVELVGDGTSLSPLERLGDVWAFPFPGVGTVLSLGDVLIAAGLAVFAALTPVWAARAQRARTRARVELPASSGAELVAAHGRRDTMSPGGAAASGSTERGRRSPSGEEEA